MNDAAKRRLLDRLRPEASRTGRARRLLATTHDLDADFFDGDFLGTGLSIAQADFAGHPAQLELQRKLAELDYAGVLCEARAYLERPSLRTVVHPVMLRGACQHAKLVVIEYEHAVRILAGSANLTSAGYRHNREVCGEHLAHDDEPKKAAQAAAMLRAARDVLATFDNRAEEFRRELGKVLERLELWAGSVPAETSPLVWSDGAHPLWQTFLERWPAGVRVERIRVVSPFWSEDGSSDTPLRRLLGELRRRNALGARCAVTLLAESAPLAEGGFAVKRSLAVYYADFPGVSLRLLPVDPAIDPAELDVKLDLTATRNLHAKLLVLESRDRALAYAGSANFTRNGFGWRHAIRTPDGASANVEAGWVFELPPAAVPHLMPPAANEGREVSSLAQPSTIVTPEEEDEAPSRFWPDTLLAAELTPSDSPDVLDLTTRWAAGTPSGWTVHASPVENEEELGPLLLTTAGGAATVTTALSRSTLEMILRRRHVMVTAGADRAAFPINVAAGEARHRLPISPAGTKPGESELLRYYQGRITFEDLYPDVDGLTLRDSPKGDASRPASSVDKSGIQAYQIRSFVDALPGMQRELLAARGSQGAIYQAFLGEVSPVAIARHVLTEVESGRRSVTAAAFQLVELGAMLRRVASLAPADVEHFAGTCERAHLEIEQRLKSLRAAHTEELSPTSAFGRYATSLEGLPG